MPRTNLVCCDQCGGQIYACASGGTSYTTPDHITIGDNGIRINGPKKGTGGGSYTENGIMSHLDFCSVACLISNIKEIEKELNA